MAETYIHKRIDTEKIKEAENRRQELQQKYEEIKSQYDNAIKSLKGNWEGIGAEVFYGAADNINSNIKNLGEVLGYMCDVLNDCLTIISQTDKQIGDGNREVGTGK